MVTVCMRRRLLIAGGRLERFLRFDPNVRNNKSDIASTGIAGGDPGAWCPVALGRFADFQIEDFFVGFKFVLPN